MKKSELIEQVAQKAQTSKAAAARVLDALFDAATGTISEAVRAGQQVSIPGFGKFRSRTRPARKGRNPKTGAEIEIPERNVVAFSPGKGLRDTMEGKASAGGSSRAGGSKAKTAGGGAKARTAGGAAKQGGSARSANGKSGGGAKASGAKAGGAKAGSAKSGGANSGGAKAGSAKSGGAKTGSAKSGGAKAGGAKSGGAKGGSRAGGGRAAGSK